MLRVIFLAVIGFGCLCATLPAQDSQSLGDIARQLRLKKQQKEAQTSAAKSVSNDGQPNTSTDSNTPESNHRVVTNEDAPEPAIAKDAAAGNATSAGSDKAAAPVNREAQAEQWKSQIQEQKSNIASLQRELDSVTKSIHYAGANCVANCVKWNERQQQKQQEVDSMKAQLEQQQHRLEDMQDTARKQGFGSSVYDP